MLKVVVTISVAAEPTASEVDPEATMPWLVGVPVAASVLVVSTSLVGIAVTAKVAAESDEATRVVTDASVSSRWRWRSHCGIPEEQP